MLRQARRKTNLLEIEDLDNDIDNMTIHDCLLSTAITDTTRRPDTPQGNDLLENYSVTTNRKFERRYQFPRWPVWLIILFSFLLLNTQDQNPIFKADYEVARLKLPGSNSRSSTIILPLRIVDQIMHPIVVEVMTCFLIVTI